MTTAFSVNLLSTDRIWAQMVHVYMRCWTWRHRRCSSAWQPLMHLTADDISQVAASVS